MAVDERAVFLVILTFLRTFDTGDAGACVFMESCILPCTFKPGSDLLLHWIRTTGDTPVHSYYNNQDQLALQDQRFRGRTSLFKDQLSSGNASLLLTRVEVQDQGSYKCYTSTISGNKESLIDLNVEAPVRRVDIQRVENRITCRSEGIYPTPGLTWSSSPPSTPALQDKPTVQRTQQQHYNISGSLLLSDSAPELVYSCTVSAGSSSRRSTLFKTTWINGSRAETTIPCTTPSAPQTDLVWRFNHSQIIVHQTRADVSYAVSEGWRQRVKSVTSGNLTLKDVSSAQQGKYTCEVSTANETYVTNTFLTIQGSEGDSAGHTAGVAGPIVLVVVVLIVLAGLLLRCYYKRRKGQHENKPDGKPDQNTKKKTPSKEGDEGESLEFLKRKAVDRVSATVQ